MDPWLKETLGLEVGDFIIWQDEAIEVEGQPAVMTPGMKIHNVVKCTVNAGCGVEKSPPTACLWNPIWALFRKNGEWF